MLEDKLLVWKFNRGSENALSPALLNDITDAEDIVQEVFLGFARSAGEFQLTGSLKGYLATCVANRARSRNIAGRRRKAAQLNGAGPVKSNAKTPDQWVMHSEELRKLSDAMARLPYEQREAITLHLHGGMKFREIADLQEVSIKTTQSRYRCGLDRLRSILNSKVEK
ncbi:MAG: RNA polymerase sigma factor [Planctomycetota bacterium]|jgi:RNA polymerase sigma-70 factor (ECF subfamily)